MTRKHTVDLASQQEVYRYISSHWKMKKRSPTIREIIAETKMKSTSHVWWITKHLLDDGLLVKIEGSKGSRKYLPKWVAQAIENAEET